jgi:putative adhesin Stv-like protein
MPNYTLGPPHGLNIQGNPITVTGDTQLSQLVQPNMGSTHWAACVDDANSPHYGKLIDVLP